MSVPHYPDRPIPFYLIRLRDFLRWLRVKKIKRFSLSKFMIGNGSRFGPRLRNYSPSFLVIGNDVSIGSDFRAEVNLTISDDVLISSHVSFIGNDHDVFDRNKTVKTCARLPENTTNVCSNVFIGYGATIIGSVSIAEGCVIGAHAVITKDTEPYKVYVGIPARAIRDRI